MYRMHSLYNEFISKIEGNFYQPFSKRGLSKIRCLSDLEEKTQNIEPAQTQPKCIKKRGPGPDSDDMKRY